jgi:hypothetical protein
MLHIVLLNVMLYVVMLRFVMLRLIMLGVIMLFKCCLCFISYSYGYTECSDGACLIFNCCAEFMLSSASLFSLFMLVSCFLLLC